MKFTITVQGYDVPSIVSEDAADALEVVLLLAEGGMSVAIVADDGTACDITRLIELTNI
jgi:hypothetical protein